MGRMVWHVWILLLVLSSSALCQLPAVTEVQDQNATLFAPDWYASSGNTIDVTKVNMVTLQPVSTTHFHWKSALWESFAFLAMSHAYLAHDDYNLVTFDNGVPFNHYWRDYKKSLSTWVNSGWNDGDPFLDNYIGHPIQGALTGYIQVQNDPQGERLEFSFTKAYWRSRFKATLWSAAYSTLFEIGPMSEMTVEKYGTFGTGWSSNGKTTGVGQVDLVVTPIGGLAWMTMEDVLDKQVARRVEGATRNRFLISVTRCGVNPIRAGANILHRKSPWYRASRDAREVYRSRQLRKAGAVSETHPLYPYP